MFLHERNAIFELIRERNVSGVELLSGDSHVGELNCIPWSEHGGYDFYDLVSSPLAQGMSDSWVVQTPEVRLRPVYVRGPNFGVLDFSWMPEPTLTYTLRDVSGANVWQPLVLRAAELRNGVATWRSRIGAKELEAVERFRATGSYYGPR
jgi:alkaline phosphatase D